MAPCLWMGFIWLKAIQPLRGDSLLFTIKFPGVPGTQLIDLGSLSWLWNHPLVLNSEPLDWESSTLTTRPLTQSEYYPVLLNPGPLDWESSTLSTRPLTLDQIFYVETSKNVGKMSEKSSLSTKNFFAEQIFYFYKTKVTFLQASNQ